MYITKTTGKKQKFSTSKLRRSLRRAGASTHLANQIVSSIPVEKMHSSQDVHNYVFEQLRAAHPPAAARYDVKTALLRLGPTGYPFEQFVGALFREMGYDVKTNQVLKGKCITHEVDVIAENDERKVFMECKYHGQKSLRSNIKVALYVKARFDDIKEQLTKDAKGKKVQGLIVTNTEFSHDAENYAKCVNGLGLIAWRSPRGFSLAELIDQTGLHPVSALTTLSGKQKDQLMKDGVVLCRDLVQQPSAMDLAGVNRKHQDKVVREARAVCELRDVM